jgi:hypothetical protein
MVVMKTRWVLFGLVLPLLAAAQAAAELEEFSSKEGGFSVLLPEKEPKKEVKTQKSPDGSAVENHLFVVDRKTHVYVVAYLKDRRLAEAGEKGAQPALERGLKGAEISFKGSKLLEKKEVKLDGKYPGLEFRLEVPSVGIYRSRLYVVKDTLYQVSVLGPMEAAEAEEADKVLNSFKLLPAEKSGS